MSTAEPKSFDQASETFGKSFVQLLGGCLFVFLASYLILFLGMNRRPGIFDEGIMLTAAMRLAVHEVPHRDFYVLYGPAQFYLLAQLFRVFGDSLLVERLLDLFSKAFVVASMYAIASSYCRKWIAAFSSFIALLWLFGLNQWPGSATIPVSVFNLISSALILPVFTGRVTKLRLFAAGALASMAALFRYDTGIALIGIHLFIISTAVVLRRKEISNAVTIWLSQLWPYILGFTVGALPPAFYYLAVAPVRALVHDVFIYPKKYYFRGRNLPFPGINIHSVENLGVYLPILTACVALFVFAARYFLPRGENLADGAKVPNRQAWSGFLLTFGLITLAMFFKGFVRVGIIQMYLAIIPSLLLLAVLLQHCFSFPRFGRIAINILAALSLLAAASFAYHDAKALYLTRLSVPQYLSSVAQRKLTPMETAWCESNNPLTRGFCFLPEEDRIRTIDYIRDRTLPGQTIYVGLIEHQKIFACDNILYFATERLPATRWSELDPDLESRLDVQTQMVQEFETDTPPYMVLDSEFERMNEPNDSSRKSGVTLLDDYIRSNYQQVATFGVMSVWKRRANSSERL